MTSGADLTNLVLAIAGIVVSLITFAIGYRQTIGARRTAAARADSEIIETLLRRLVLEDTSINTLDILSVINGKASVYRIPANTLRSPELVVDLLLSRILESDLISASDRARCLEAASDLRKSIQSERDEDPSGTRSVRSVLIVIVLAGAAAVLGLFTIKLISPEVVSKAFQSAYLVAVTIFLGLLGLVLAARGRAGARVSTLVTNAQNPVIRELNSYPSDYDGPVALKRLLELTPFAVRNLYQFAEDEIRSMQFGTWIGLRGSPELNLGLAELLAEGYVESFTPPSKKKQSKPGKFYRMTPLGRSLGRLLTAALKSEVPEAPPRYLEGFVSKVPESAETPVTISTPAPNSVGADVVNSPLGDESGQ